MQETIWRAIATIVMWVMIAGSFALGGVFLAPVMGEDVVIVFIMLMVTAIVSSGFIWNWGKGTTGSNRNSRLKQVESELDNYTEKRKRDRLAVALSQLSEDELVNIKDRIRRGEIGDEELEYVLREGR